MFTTGKRARRGTLVAVGAAVAICATACSSGKESVAGGDEERVTGKVSLVYLQKQGDQEYFVAEAAGARAKARQLGVDLKVVDLGNDANEAVSQVQTAVAQKANGIIIVVPDPAVGPQVVRTVQDAGVTLLTSDDQICTNKPDPASCDPGQLVPRVGFSGRQMGTEVGKRAGEEFKKAGWKASETRIIAAWKQDITVCTDRVVAAQQAFDQTAGQNVRVIKVGTDNTPPDAQNKVAATITANRSVKNWIVWGCNDENVSGGVTALQNSGIPAANIIGVGLGANLACKDWKSGKTTGMRAALFINGYDVGGLAVQTIYDKLKNGKAMPAEVFAPTKMVDADTWQQAGVKCG